MRILLQIFSVLISIPIFTSFTPTTPRPVHLAKLPSRLLPTHLSSSYLDSLTLPSPSLSNIQSLKSELFSAIKELNKLKEKEGDFSIDFGVKGGELDKKSRRPAKLDFNTISPSVGLAADRIFSLVSSLTPLNPTPTPTKNFLTPSTSPLSGRWNLLFSTAADATFSSNSTRGSADPYNVVDSERGMITNVIQFRNTKDGKKRLVNKLRVKIRVATSGASRFYLTFRYACVHFTRILFLPIPFRLYIPVPGTFLTRLIFTVMGRRGEIPKPYFDVLYLDGDLRIHKTGEDNLFVQRKEGFGTE